MFLVNEISFDQMFASQVLFPLLDRVKQLSSQASDRRDENGSSRSGMSGGGGNILMHHSRDTAEKQWAETRFLTLAGVARVFNAKRRTLQQLGMALAGVTRFSEESFLIQFEPIHVCESMFSLIRANIGYKWIAYKQN